MRILLTETDSATAQNVEVLLKGAGCNVFVTDLGEECADLARRFDYDIILLDPKMPDMNGREVLRTLREAKVKTPVVILSDPDAVEDMTRGFGFGAADFITKPFMDDELVAGIGGVMERWRDPDRSLIEAGGLSVDLSARTVRVGGEILDLECRYIDMLELLARRKGMTVTGDELAEHIYGTTDGVPSRMIAVLVGALGKRLQRAGPGVNPVRIVLGKGYSLRDPEPGTESDAWSPSTLK